MSGRPAEVLPPTTTFRPAYAMSHFTLGTADFSAEQYVNVVRQETRPQYAHLDDMHSAGPSHLPGQALLQPLQPLQAQHLQHLQHQPQTAVGMGYLPDTGAMLGEGSHRGDPDEDDDYRDDQDGGSQDPDTYDDDGSRGSKRPRIKKPHLQGRFSGRLATKEDERRLAEECKLLGPLLGGVGKRGDKSRLTLAKIVRGIATGDIRRYCEERERLIQALKNRLAAVDPNGNTTQLEGLRHENSILRNEIITKDEVLQELSDKGIIAGFVPSILPGQPAAGMMQQERFAPYPINVRRDRPPLPQFLPLGGQGRPPVMPGPVMSADYVRRDHSAPLIAAALSDGPTMSGASRAGPPRPPVQRKMVGAASEPFSPATQTVSIHNSDIHQQLANLQAQVEQLQNLQHAATAAPAGITVPLNNTMLAGNVNMGQSLQFQPAGAGRFAVQFSSHGQGGPGDLDVSLPVELKGAGDGHNAPAPNSSQLQGDVQQQQALRAMPALDLRVAQAAAASRAGLSAANVRYVEGVGLQAVEDSESWRV